MEQGVTELIGLLKAFTHEVPLSRAEMQELDAALPQVLYFAKLHNVMGIWAYKVREYYAQNPAANAEEQEVADAAQQIFSRTVARGAKRTMCYQALSQILSDNGIDHLPFKGIEVKSLYPVPELRTFGDVDFVIHKEDRERCHTLMQTMNYEVVVDYEPVYTYRKEGELYEIHTGIMSVNITNRADYIGYFQNLWDNANLTENHSWTFTPEFHFVYLLSHIAKHIYGSGAGIRMYLDLALYIKCLGDTMNWSVVQEELKKLELTRFFHLTLESLKRWFGVSLPISVPKMEESLLEDFTVFTMEAGVFGFEGRKPGKQYVRKQGNHEKKGLRIKALKMSLFPSVDVLENRYGYLKTRRWLLPIAWTERLFCNLRKIGRKMEETKDIIGMKDEEIQKINTFYRRIGL